MYRRYGIIVATAAVMAGLGYFNFPNDNIPGGIPPDNVLSERCSYDTRVLCRACFPAPTNCSVFTGEITFKKSKDEFMKEFNAHSVRLDLADEYKDVIINNLNRNEAVEALQYSVCEELNTTDDCFWWDKERYIEAVRRRVLTAENRTKGIVFCPPDDEEGLTRFMQYFDQKELLTLILMATNSQSLLLRLFFGRSLPVPILQLQEGFILVETYEGEPLSNLYQIPLKSRLQISNELINAFIKFTTGIEFFSIVPMHTSPDNIFVEIYPNKVPKVTFTELSDVTVVDRISDIHINNSEKADCCIRYGEKNLHKVCQILLEDNFGNVGHGFLHNEENGTEFIQLRTMLESTMRCGSPNCEHRQKGLERIQQLISKILRTYFN